MKALMMITDNIVCHLMQKQTLNLAELELFPDALTPVVVSPLGPEEGAVPPCEPVAVNRLTSTVTLNSVTILVPP